MDLNAYLRRIAYTGDVQPTVTALTGLHLAHTGQIPFENIDILLGEAIRLDLPSLEAKLVRGRRGGYCFEQNTLFAEVLRQIGFEVACLAARVCLGANRVAPRTHMALLVTAEGRAWLADVGFGGQGILQPLPLAAGEYQQFGWTYELATFQSEWMLRFKGPLGWQDQYRFTLEPQLPVDFDVANYYVSTHPQSIFVRTLTAQRALPEARHVLLGWEYSIIDGAGSPTRSLAGHDELCVVLENVFGLHLPAGTTLTWPGD
jgi:N-hydroxyarylamine O-acetyltransferase